ncbi:MAG: hypothetical protein ABR520_04225 [Mycobacteriales bacterium]|nr:hypothetical protein [Frankia sp.]
MTLRSVDERALAASARVLRRAGRWAQGRWRGTHAAVRGTAARLGDVDRRYARRGPLAVLRDLPQAGAVVLALIFVAAAGTVLDRTGPAATTPSRSESAPPMPAVPDGYVGPRLGDNVHAYAVAATARLRERALGAPDEHMYAVVSLTGYLSPRQLRALLGPLRPVRIFFRVPPPPAQTAVNQGRITSDLLADADHAFAVTSDIRRRAAVELRRAAAGISDADPAQQQRIKDYDLQTARYLEHEARVLRPGCTCVFGVAVEGQARQLLALAAYPRVRLVDPGPQGAPLDQLVFRALLPEERKIVTGGNEVVPRG